jgi:hypothetical protein
MAHKMLSFEQVKSTAEKYSDVVIKETVSGQMLFTIYGGRLLGMWPKKGGSNPLWVYPDLDDAMKNGQWMVGGERLWVAPERHFFYENPRDFDGFHVPAEIDPGEYVGTGELVFESVFSLLDYRKNEMYDGSVCKREFSVTDDPFGTKLPFAGARITDTVSVPSAKIDICGWSLAQIYTCGSDMPGTALYPVAPNARILSYFNTIPSDRAEICGDYARFRIDANGTYKLAIRPEDIAWNNPCKTVYLTPAPDGRTWMCLIKSSSDLPRNQSECLDIPKSNPDGERGAIQSYNIGPEMVWNNGEFPYFGEIELQLAKGMVHGGSTVSRATHDLLAWEGDKNSMIEIAKTALKTASAVRLY